jgi:hypothetical protein
MRISVTPFNFMRLFCLFILGFLTLPLLAFAQSTSESKPFPKFVIYQDKTSRNHYTPSGYMPTGECIKMDDNWKQDCHEGKSCIKVNYDVACSVKSRHWAGVYWLNPPDNWGDRKGGFNLTGATKLVFWAKGEKGGEQIAEFKVGGIGSSRDYPDSDSAFIGPVILTNQWKEYFIDLRNRDLSYISGGFAWSANVDDNPSSCVFFLDDIHFE